MTEDIEYIYQLFYKKVVKIKEKEKNSIRKKTMLTINHCCDKSRNKIFRHTGRIVSSVVKWRPW